MEHPIPLRRSDLRFYKTGGAARLCLLVLLALAVPATAQPAPAWSRGEQLLPIGYDECMRRAGAGLTAEGYGGIQAGGAYIAGQKDIHTAVIMCNVAPEGKTWANIVVASNHHDGNVPGAERVRLQQWMDRSASGGFSGRWRLDAIVPSGQPYPGTYTIEMDLTERDGSLSGTGTWSNGAPSTFTGEVRNGEVVLHRVDPGGFRGIFQGRVTGEGRMEGIGQNDPASPGGNTASYTWTAYRLP